MDYSLKELLDVPKLRKLLDSLDEIHCMPSAIIDIEGNILTATGWQDICTNFHRATPYTERMCLESDRTIGARLGNASQRIVYRCPMGLTETAKPIIIDGKHLGNVFIGQLITGTPDEEYFIKQARQYGFDEGEYLEALRKVPIFHEDKLHKNLTFIHSLAQILAEQGLQHKQQCAAEETARKSEEALQALTDTLQEQYEELQVNEESLREQNDELMAFEETLRVQIIEYETSQKQLKESEERFRSLMVNIPNVAVQGYTLDGTVIFWNRASELLYGYNAEEALHSNLLDLIIPPEMKEGVTDAIQQMTKTGIPIPPGELLLLRKDGSRIPVFSSHALVHPVGGQPELFCLDIDLTERKQAEQLLIESEYRWKFAIEGSGDGVWDWNILSNVATYSKRWQEMMGYSENDSLPTSLEWVDRIHPDDQAFVANALQDYLEEKTAVYVVEHRLRCKNESYKWVLGRGMVVSRGEDGEPLRMIGTHTDITDRKAHENEQLKIAKLESLGILAGGIAHDFNNILAGIIGNISLAQVLLEATHTSQKPLIEAEKASVRATELAHQLLTFARGGEPVKKLISIQNIVEETISLALHGSNVKCNVNIPDSIHAIEADEGQMSQVFHNIIINATQAMPTGGTLTITAQNVRLNATNTLSIPAGNYIRLSFTDQGCGISDGDLKKIFDPYFTTKASGNGLGLASVHSIIGRHGGHITANSVAEKGTTFTIHLPTTGKTYAKHHADFTTRTAGHHAGGSILVMDDEKMIRDMATEMCEYLGYQVTTCLDGTEAVKHYKAAMESGAPFSVVIMDLTIPGGMGGKETAELLLVLDPKARLIVSSGYSNDPIMSDYSRYGFSGAVAKPYKIMEFGQLLSSLLSVR